MKKKTIYTLNVGDQDYEDMQGEENKDNTATTGVLYSEADRCPICLSCLLEKEIGFPESCNHVFCLTCILKWAETLPSCPIDRKPFQAVVKFSVSEGCVKVQVKRQLRETKDKKNESSFKKQLSCQENSKSCMRKKIIGEDLLSVKFYDLKMIHRNSKYSEMGGKKNSIIKTNKPRRSNPYTNQCFRNFFSNVFSSSSHTGESSFSRTAYCTEFIEVNEISALIRQKRQELELSWFPDTLPGIGRISFIPWNIEIEVLPLISSVLPRTILPTSTISLENFGTSCKGYTLAHTQEGEEKKQTSGTSNTRGSRRKPAAATPTRRSTRNTRAEPVSQSQRSPVSNVSGCDAPDNNNPSVSVSSSGESEKQTRQAPKRKSVRRGRKLPLLKKKLRSSVPPPEKSSSSDSVDEEVAEPDIPPELEKEHQSDVESINTVQINIESESANGLRSCSEPLKESEECTETHDTEERVETLHSESDTQDPPVLLGGEEEVQKVENTSIEANVLCLESEISASTSKKGSDPLENQDPIAEPSESEIKADICIDHVLNDSLTCSGSEIEVYQSASNLCELPENAEPIVNEEKVMESPIVKIIDPRDSTVKTEQLIDSPKLESSEGGVIQAVDTKSIESSEVLLLGHVENEDAEIIATCDTSGNETLSSIQDSENSLFKKNLNTKLDKSLEEKTESLVEYPRSTELPKTHLALIQKHFSEDNNEMIPMECDSFCSDQNESEIEPSVNADAKQVNENSVEHSSQKNMSSSDPANEKVETVSQPSENPVDATDKAKKPRTRRSRFHSPSTTWSPNKDTAREKKRSQSPSPKRETGKDSRKSRSPSPKKESVRGRRKSRSQSPKKDSARERRRSQSRSPKRDSAKEGKRSESLSPKRENRRSQSRVKDSSPREKSRSQSRERESDRDGSRRDRDRERRMRRWSRSRSRSRSPSRSRTKSKGSSFGRNDRDSYSPRWKERWANDGWRCPRGNDRYRKSDSEKQNENTRKEKNDINTDADDSNSADKHRNDCPTWVTEKINSGPDPRIRNPEKLKDSHWEENRNENSGNSWNKNFSSAWMSNRGRGNRGRGNHRGGFAYTDQNENRWQNRKPLSGNSNSSGNETFKFVEQQPYKRKSEQEFSFDTPADRSGWTSASSWAVRKTLPADVQNYYSRRGRSSSGPQSGWMRQDEETAEQESNLKDQTNQQGDGSQLPMNMMQPQMNAMQQHMSAHQPVNMFPYPVGVPAPLMNIQRSPFSIHPQLPLHLHTGVPLMQVAAPGGVSQGLPPPPPPPPPSQQVGYIASQPDGKQLQGIPSASHVSNNMSTPVLPAPTAAPGNMGTVQGPSSGNTASSSHSKASNAAVKLAESKVSVTVEASADSSKTDKKLQIQEKAAQEVKLAIKPFYQNKDITKEEYKEIVRKAVDKVPVAAPGSAALKMAERAGGGTSLRGLRERMVAAANAIAEERRSQGSFSSLPSQPSNIKSPFKPVIDGSVLKNDIKQRLAKERREEKKRQDDANKETQLLEKERKSKIVYEKQMEEKQRKLREQKEKDEQRRISAEKKRNEMLEEEREKFKAVLHRTLERSSRVDRQKRWSWAGYTTVNSQNKTVNKHSTCTEKLEQGTCGLHRQMSSTGLQNSVAKKTPEKRRSSSLNRRCSRLHSSTETEQIEEKRSGIHSVIQYVNIPLLRHSSDELKSTIVPRQSTAVMPFQEKVEIPSKTSVGVAPKASVEVPPEVSVEALTKASLDESPQVNVEAPPEVSVEAFPEETMKKHPKVSVETFLEASMKEHPGVNVEALAEESMKEHPGVNVEALAEESMKEHPKVRVDALLEVSMKEHPAVSVEALPEESMKEHPAVSVEALAEESMKEHPKVRVDALLKVSMKEHPEVSVEALVEASMKEHPAVNVEALAEASMKEHPKVSVDSLPEVSTEEHPKVSVEALPEVNMEGPCANVETSPETSEDLSLEAHVGPSPEVSMDSSPDVSVNPSPEVSMDSSQEVSTEASSEASVDISPEASMVTLPEESVETSPEESVEAFSAASMDALPEGSVEVLPKEPTKGPSEASVEAPLETSPEVTVEISSKKSEMDEQPSNPITKKRIPPSQIPCYRWSSSPTRRWRPPSPISASRQIQKNCPPSPSPGTSKQSTQFCFSYKVIPTQRTVFAQNALGTMGMKSKAVSNTINNSEAPSQKDMICEESGNKGTPGPKNAEEATKILAEKRRLAREQKEKEERLQKEMEQRKMKDVAKKVDDGQEDEFSKFGDGQQPKEMKKRESQEQEDQKVELQKSDAKIKAQEEADKRKKEHERIMLQNLQERLERKKRIEEIMKRTRKPDSNASKATETLSSDAYEEDEADDEDESESDGDSFDDVHPSATINGVDSSPKPKTHVKNVKNTSKFLDVTSSHIHKETKAFLNTDMKTFRQKGVKDPLNQTKSTRSSTKRPTNRAAKTGKAETSSTMRPSRSSHSEVQKWVCDRIINFSRETEPPVSSFPPESPKLQLRGSVTSCLSHQPPIDNKNRSKSVPAPSDM